MKRRLVRLLGMGGVILGGWLVWGATDRAPGELPQSIASWVRQLFPDTEVVEIEQDGDDDDLEYEITLRRSSTGQLIELEASPHVGITEYEEELSVDDLPPRVRQMLHKTFPGARLGKARKRSEIRIEYELEIQVGDRRREVRLSPKGRILEVEKRD